MRQLLKTKYINLLERRSANKNLCYKCGIKKKTNKRRKKKIKKTPSDQKEIMLVMLIINWYSNGE